MDGRLNGRREGEGGGVGASGDSGRKQVNGIQCRSHSFRKRLRQSGRSQF